MKAVRLVNVGRPVELQELPVPHIGPNDILVRVKAAGICHSDVHYRAGVSPVDPMPLTLGHEVAGVVEELGNSVTAHKKGDRVCLHYLVACGDCLYCRMGHEQFCTSGKMLGKFCDGGYAEYISVPARNAFHLPDEVSFEHGAIMMCSSATSYHALRKGRLRPGETVAVFGVGGLGMSAIQLAKAFGALDVYAVDLNPDKLALAEKLGAIPVKADETDPVTEIHRLTQGRGVDVALELIGMPLTIEQSVKVLAILGRAVVVGISAKPVRIETYQDLMGKEAELIGSSDHVASELPPLLELARRGVLDLSQVTTDTVPLEAKVINVTMDRLERFAGPIRVVISP